MSDGCCGYHDMYRTEMDRLERRAKEWHERQHGEVDLDATINKLFEEYSELAVEVQDAKYDNLPPTDPIHRQHVLEEAGDVIMVLSHIIRRYGGTIEGCWKAAIEKCERRERTGER